MINTFDTMETQPHLCSGKNVVHQLSVTLDEMYNGSTRKLGLQKNVICEKCEGRFNSLIHMKA